MKRPRHGVGDRLTILLAGLLILGMAIQRGATISLRKPFSPSQLNVAIDQSLGLAPTMNGVAQ